jgi:hypothetical protein
LATESAKIISARDEKSPRADRRDAQVIRPGGFFVLSVANFAL